MMTKLRGLAPTLAAVTLAVAAALAVAPALLASPVAAARVQSASNTERALIQPAGSAPRTQALSAPAVDSLVQAFHAAHRPVGLVVAVTTPAGDHIAAHGVPSLEKGAPPVDGASRFEAGSITKVFTALLLADMAARGEVSLDDPIGEYLPDDVAVPAFDGEPITLRHLAMHTSGLPRLPANLVPADMADPYAAYDEALLHDFLRDFEPTRAPGERYEYSNLGAGLLGHLLARRAGKPFDALVAERILEPLGMRDSYIAGEENDGTAGDDDARLATGYVGQNAVAWWHFGALPGAGALRSTATDLLRLLRAQLEPGASPLEAAIHLSRRNRAPVAENVSIALGWHVSALPDGTEMFWHNGITGGFRGFVGFAPAHDVGVVVLTNSAVPPQAVDQLAVQVALMVAGERSAEMP